MAGICILTETFHPVTGGGETQSLALASGFSRLGYEVCVVTRRSDRALAGTELYQGVRIHRVAPSGKGQLRKWALLVTAAGALIRQRRRYRFIIVSGFRLLGIPAVIVARLSGKAVILKADNMGEMSGEYFRDGLAKIGLQPGSWPVRIFLRLRNALFRSCNGFVAISSPVYRELETHGVPVSAIARIPNSVDTERFRPPVSAAEKLAIRETLGIPLAAFVVVYTGRLVDYKGVPLLLRVWQAAHAAYGECRLLLVGGGGLDMHNCETALRDFVREHGLGETVIFTGSVDDVRSYLQASDVFVLPTEREAFGISLIEAMSCALPVIATRVGGIPDILQDSAEGCLVDPADFRQLRNSLDRLFGDEGLRRRMGERARKSALQRYSEPAVLERYLQLPGIRDAGESADVVI